MAPWSTVKRITKTCNLFCNIFAKWVGKWCWAFYHPRSNLSCNKSDCCKLPKRRHLIGYNCAGVIYLTCCKTGFLEHRLQQTCLRKEELLSGCFSFVRTGRPDHCWTSHFNDEIGFFWGFLLKNHLLPAHYLGFDWSDWIVLINSEILITNGKHPLSLLLLYSGSLYVVVVRTKLLPTFCNNFSQPATNWLTARQLWFVGGICFSTCFAAMLQNKLHIFVARYTNYQSRASYHDICEPWLLLTRLQTNQSWNIKIFKMLNSFL